MPVFLLIAGLLVHGALTAFYVDRVYQDGVAERTQEQLDAVRGTVRTLILGDSHAKWGVAAAGLEDAFNLALEGQTAAESYYLLESELEAASEPLRAVVLSADAQTFSDWQKGVFAQRHWYAPRVDYLEIGRRRGEPLRYAVNGWLGRYAPYVGQREGILRYLETGSAPQLTMHRQLAMERGSFLYPGSWTDVPEPTREELARQRADLHFPSPGFDDVSGSYFRETLALASAAGLRVVVVRYPLSREYLEASRPFVETARVDARLAEILAEHREVLLLDARRDYADRPQLFIDPDHLNGRGARRFTRRVRRLLARGG